MGVSSFYNPANFRAINKPTSTIPKLVNDNLFDLVTSFRKFILGGAATCSEGFVICFLIVPLACLSSMAAAV